MTTATIAAVCRIFRAFETGNLSDAAEYVHPEYFNHESIDRTGSRGPAELAHSVDWLRSAFSELAFHVEDIIATNDRVAVHVVMSGRHSGSFLGHPPTGRRFAAEQVHLFSLRDGTIREHRAIRDDLSMHRQLGLLTAKRPPT